MKRSQLLSLFAIPLLFVSCDDDVIVNDNLNNPATNEGEAETSRQELSKVITGIEILGPVSVKVTHGGSGTVLEAPEAARDHLIIETVGKTLKVKTTDVMNKSAPLKLQIALPAPVERINIAGAAILTVSRVSGKKAILNAAGASSMTIEDIQCETLEIHSLGASNVTIKAGVATESAATALGASKISMGSTRGNFADAKAVGASYIKLGDYRELKLDALGASQIRYIGNPTIKSQKAAGFSSIKAD